MTADYRQLIALQRAARDLQRLALDVTGSMTGEEWAAQKLRAAVGDVVGLVDVLGTMVRMPQGNTIEVVYDSALLPTAGPHIVIIGGDEDGQHD